MFRSSIICGLWDLVDFGQEEGLDRIRATGVTGVTVVVTSGPAAILRSGPACPPRIFRTRGGFFFQPQDSSYANSRIKPIVSTWLRGRNPLEAVARACTARGLELRLRISAFGVGRIAQRHPECAGKTVFGDIAPLALCPAHSDVRALLTATVADLSANYAPAAVEIDDLRYHSGAWGENGLEIGFEPDESILALLSVCFSEASRQQAAEEGIDAAAAARVVEEQLDEALAGRAAKTDLPDKQRERNEALRRYLDLQVVTLDRLIEQIADTAGGPIRLVWPPAPDRQILPSARGRQVATSLVIEQTGFDEGDAGDSFSPSWSAMQHLAPVGSLELEVDLGDVSPDETHRLVSAVKQAADRGIGGISFAHLGVLNEAGFTAIRQAVRYAVRSTT
jgi:hypothetical protein